MREHDVVFRGIERTCARTAAVTFGQLRRGVTNLAVIACVAPWLGLLATVDGVVWSFGPCSEQSMCLGMIAQKLAWALWPSAFGLAIGILALYCHRSLTAVLRTYQEEMAAVPATLMDQLSWNSGRWEYGALPPAEAEPALWREYRGSRRRWRTPVCVLLILAAWCIETMAYMVRDSYDLQWAMFRAVWYVAFVFGVAVSPAHVAWVRLRGGSHSGRTVVAAILCLTWCMAELIFRLHLL